MTTTRTLIPGYEAEIHRSLWERVTMLGAPRLWSMVWVASCLYAGLIVFLCVGIAWVLGLGVLWIVGQGILVFLTQLDPYWDEIGVARLTRRYQSYYRAG